MSENITSSSESSGDLPNTTNQFDVDNNELQKFNHIILNLISQLVNATVTPINYVWEVELQNKITFLIGMIILTGVVYPTIVYMAKYFKTLCNPVTFPYKHVLITGCGTGLGKALVSEIYMKGAYITMIGRDKDKLVNVAQSVDVRQYNHSSSIQVNYKTQPLINVIVADITELREKDIEYIIRQSEQMYGPIEMLVNCAAISKPAMILFSSFDQYNHHMNLNYLGALKFILPIAKRMQQRKAQGRLVLIGDTLASHYAIPGMAPYACSKSAIEQLAFQLKAELEPHDIKVHYFLPPAMETSLLEEQKKMYPLVTRCLMKNQVSTNPEQAAALLMRGISMGQNIDFQFFREFIINGTWTAEIMSTLKCTSKYIFSIICSPIAIAIRQYSDGQVKASMLQQKALKTLSH